MYLSVPNIRPHHPISTSQNNPFNSNLDHLLDPTQHSRVDINQTNLDHQIKTSQARDNQLNPIQNQN